MSRRKDWSYSEEKRLMDNYQDNTIQELKVMFPRRYQESINNKIKRLKAEGRIKGGKEASVIQRAYEQRGKDIFITID